MSSDQTYQTALQNMAEWLKWLDEKERELDEQIARAKRRVAAPTAAKTPTTFVMDESPAPASDEASALPAPYAIPSDGPGETLDLDGKDDAVAIPDWLRKARSPIADSE